MRSEVIIDPRLSFWLDRVSEFFDAMFRDKLQIFHYSAVTRGANAEQSPISSRRCSLDARSMLDRSIIARCYRSVAQILNRASMIELRLSESDEKEN